MADLAGGVDRRTLLKGMLAGAAGVATAGGLAGCGGGVSAGADPQQLWHLFSGADGAKLSQMLGDVQAKYPTVNTQATCLAWGSPYYTKLAMASAGKRPPDTAVMHVSRLSGYAPGGLLEPFDLSRLSVLGVTKESVAPALWERCLYQGQLYSLPLDTHPFIAYYNLEIAEKAGLLGTDGQMKAIESTDQFLDAGRKLAEVTKQVGISFGFVLDAAQAWRLFWGFYGQTGGKYSFQPGQKAEWDNDKAIQVITFIAKMLDGKIAAKEVDYPGAISYFTSGASGMILSGEWETPAFQKSIKRLGASPMPTLFGTPASYADSHSFVLPSRLVHDDARLQRTYELVTGLMQDAVVWAQGGHIPAYLPTTKEPAYLALKPQASYAGAASSVFLDPPVWFSGAGSDFQNQMSTRLQKGFLGGSSPAETSASMLEQITTMLQIPNPA
jgi:multiple sugar transport system substrate-binding protein